MTLCLTQPLQLSSPAKINLHLYVQGKRPDGYHELQLDLIPISWFDQLRFCPPSQPGFRLVCNLENVPQESNLVTKALRLLEKEVAQEIHLDLELTKQIPSGAGLGGGSGNAAALLVVLNQALQLGISPARLAQMALSLGADVPFFIDPRPAWGFGLGERLTPLANPPNLWLVLLFPGFGISTQEAYRHCHHSGRKLHPGLYTPQALAGRGPEHNDFWPALVQLYPALETARQALLAQGALLAGMSGSGSCLYGVFADALAQKKALQALQGVSPSWMLHACQSLAGHSYLK